MYIEKRVIKENLDTIGKRDSCSLYSDICHRSIKLAAKAVSQKAALLVLSTLDHLHDEEESICKEDRVEGVEKSAINTDATRVKGLQNKNVGEKGGRNVRKKVILC